VLKLLFIHVIIQPDFSPENDQKKEEKREKKVWLFVLSVDIMMKLPNNFF